MSSNKQEKQYGLILPKKQQDITRKISNVFGDNDDSDEEDGNDWVKKALQAESEKNKVKKQTKLNMQKALKEDPTIYQYDEIYDDMERTKEQTKVTKDAKKKSRYIQNLLNAAERRKKEHEYRIERMVQKEREAEGAMYADKESFVTSAYRAKLEEFKKMEEEENKMDRLESIADVRKQQDMSGFYRHLYAQTVKSPSQESDIKDNTSISKTTSNDLENLSTDANTIEAKKEQIKNKEMKKSRQYRQRIMEEDSDTDETASQQKVENQAKAAIMEKQKDIESETEGMETVAKKQKQDTEDTKTEETCNEDQTENIISSKNIEEVPENCESNEKAEKASISAKAKLEAERKERSKIWEKRTVGPVFEAALQRYYTRKAARLSAA